MTKKQKMINTLAERVDAADSIIEYNIAEDLKKLNGLLGIVTPKMFRKKLSELIEKYENGEGAEIRAAVAEKARKGDLNAVRLYMESFSSPKETAENDGLLEALAAGGKKVFDNEI